nr:Ig-like domain-containing protein [Methanobacterium petrolearium]
MVKSGDNITITTTSDPDTQSVKAYIQDNTYQLTKNQDNTWSMEYTTPLVGDGVYSILLIARDLVGNTNHTPLTFIVDNTPPVINPEIIPEAGKPGETINITANASADTQSVVAIIGTQRINLTFTNGIWTTTYIIPLDATFDIHTIRIEGTDNVGNIGKNTASYEVLDPNPIPPWLEDLINPDTPNPGNKPTITTNTGPGNNGGSGNGGSGSGSDNDGSDSGSGTGSNYNPNTTTQLEDDIDYIRKRFRDITGITKAQDTIEDIKLPNWKLTIDPPDIDQWDILDMTINAAGELLFLGYVATTPGGNEYLQQVQTGMSTGIKSIKTGLRYFTKDRRIAFDLIKKGFKTIGKSFVDDSFMKSVSDRTFMLDPNVAQEALVRGLCKIFPKQAPEIRTFFTLLGSINFIEDPFGILKAWGDVVYSLFTKGIPQGNYEETTQKFWEAIRKTFTEPIPNPLP